MTSYKNKKKTETLMDMEVGHHYQTTYPFFLCKNEQLQVDPSEYEQGKKRITEFKSFFVVNRIQQNPLGRVRYQIMTPEYICWIYLDESDRENIRSLKNYSLVEIKANAIR